NHELARDKGGFVAIVDLGTGTVTRTRLRASLAYFNPGCGTGERATISSYDGAGQTIVDVVDTATARTVTTIAPTGEVTSAVPNAGGVAAVSGTDLIALSGKGKRTVLSHHDTVPFRLHPDPAGGLAYEVPMGDQVQVYRYAAGTSRKLATGASDRLQ